jgi:hypothetical protein
LQWVTVTVIKQFCFCTRQEWWDVKAGNPHQIRYTDSYGEICTHIVECPQLISNFFAGCNAIDAHNPLRQDLLRLERKWATQNPWFQLATTYDGICVTDAYLLCNYHHVIIVFNGGDDAEKSEARIFL